MATDLKPGDHVEWNSEAGRVRGTIQKKVTKEIVFKGYKRHASLEEPQYLIKSDKTDHLAIRDAIEALDRASKPFATRRMNKALEKGFRGRDVDAVDEKLKKAGGKK